ncbi:GNAT family N-acetyltransferase [Nocardia takedensis]|uniref:GNAT family N-acetyltransferase n=1 Tax=Nocardia takedensis TaxID=259390 RepID=UPI003F75AAB5
MAVRGWPSRRAPPTRRNRSRRRRAAPPRPRPSRGSRQIPCPEPHCSRPTRHADGRCPHPRAPVTPPSSLALSPRENGSRAEHHRRALGHHDLSGPEIKALLREHLAEMREHSPDGSMHALDVEGLRDPSITMWSARLGPDLVGCGALRRLDDEHAEIKSLRTAAGHAGRGVATAV